MPSKKQGSRQQLAKMSECASIIRQQTQLMKQFSRDAIGEMFGKEYVFEAESRYAVLRALVINALKRLKFFK